MTDVASNSQPLIATSGVNFDGTIPVITTSNIVAPTTPPTTARNTRISFDPAGVAPDSSGKPAYQYAAIIGNYSNAYASVYHGQRAVLEASSYDGFNNFVLTTNGPTLCTLLVW